MKPKARKTKALKIGIAAAVTLLLFYFGFNFLKGINLFDSSRKYYVHFPQAKDLTVSTPVSLDGYRVGLVREINFDYDNLNGVIVEMALDKDLKIPVGSLISIKGNPLSGSELAIIKPKVIQGFYKPNDTIPSFQNSDIMAQVQDDLIPSISSMINKMDTLIMGLDKIVNNPYIYNTFEEISATSVHIRKSSESIRQMIDYQLPAIMDDVKATTGQLTAFSEKMNKVDLERTMMNVDSAVYNINQIAYKMTLPDNTLGKLLHDTSLYDSLKRATDSTDSLLVDLRVHPQRYVTFSIF